MNKKRKFTLFSEPAISDRQLIMFLHWRVTKIMAEIWAIKEIATEEMNEEKLAQVSKLSEHYFDEAMKIYEHDAKRFFDQANEKPEQN